MSSSGNGECKTSLPGDSIGRASIVSSHSQDPGPLGRLVVQRQLPREQGHLHRLVSYILRKPIPRKTLAKIHHGGGIATRKVHRSVCSRVFWIVLSLLEISQQLQACHTSLIDCRGGGWWTNRAPKSPHPIQRAMAKRFSWKRSPIASHTSQNLGARTEAPRQISAPPLGHPALLFS